MATFSTIRAKIKTILEAVDKVSFVFDYHEPKLTGFPAVTFDVSQNESEFLTNRENLRTVSYTIVIYQEISVKGLSEAKRILDAVADDVIDAFEDDFNLGGEVDWCVPLAGPRGQFQTPAGVVTFQQLTLQCNFRFTVT